MSFRKKKNESVLVRPRLKIPLQQFEVETNYDSK